MTHKLSNKGPPSASAGEVASLEHLTGPSGGSVDWLFEDSLDVLLDPHRHIHIEPSGRQENGLNIVARIERKKENFEIHANDDQSIWVNGVAVKSKKLNHLDMIEFCDTGPMSRYYVHSKDEFTHRSIDDILGNAIAYFRNSRQPFLRRLGNTIRQLTHRFVSETTLLFRAGVIVILVFLTVLIYQQIQLSRLLQQQVQSDSSKIEDISKILARSRKEALTPGDLESLRVELGERMSTTADRISDLESRGNITQRIIQSATPSVVFLQGSYGFLDVATDRMLRLVLSKNEQPVLLPNGAPLLSTQGEGPLAERHFVGSGFILKNGTILTNKHVGLPWEYDGSVKSLTDRGLKPVITRFHAYRHGYEGAEAVELAEVSADNDLAILRYLEKALRSAGLSLSETSPSVGDQVIVMGYPTGIRSMIAQAGEGFISELQKAENLEPWEITDRLSKSGLISPLASRGIVGRVSNARIVYDAETTHGGSGGPVLNMAGKVIAVNAAILPEFGGSNLGISMQQVKRFLESINVKSSTSLPAN
ncbi:MAG: serine protease [Pseudomonadota bacterium]